MLVLDGVEQLNFRSHNWIQASSSDFPPPTRHFIQHLLRSLPTPRYLFPFSGTTHKANIAFLGLLTGVTLLP